MPQRIVIPELLDFLPHDDPAAQRSRKDLERINFLMGNDRWILRQVRKHRHHASSGIVEIGAGNGKLCTRLAQRFPKFDLAAYDLQPRPDAVDMRVKWNQGDIFKLDPAEGGILIANLFLHHFQGEETKRLGRWFSGFQALIFCEPNRTFVPRLLGWTLRPFINDVTHHDLHSSIRAGFKSGEIEKLFGLDPRVWRIEETWSWRGARRMVACKVES